MDRNLILQNQIDVLKIRALRAYFDFRKGWPTVESAADKLGIPLRTALANTDFCLTLTAA